jgi:serine protease AprX
MRTMGTAMRDDDLIASYSSKGPTLLDHIAKPDLVAPGNLVVSSLTKNVALYGAYPGNEVYISSYQTAGTSATSAAYYKLSGTSMATPVVSGAAVLMLQKEPSLTPDTVKARLMRTASKRFPPYSTATDPITGAAYHSQYDVFTIGAGYLDIPAALSSTAWASLPALSPKAARDSSGLVYLVKDSSALWGESALWGYNAVWGDSALWGESALWGTSAVWGDSTTTGYSALWGESALWGTGISSSQALQAAINGDN